ncbi:hypothetical protein C0995_006036 [Termitomyces sp. Mi166|nr:hypothetical protein C0995_006036 [Termitomyces sp. Mi166\
MTFSFSGSTIDVVGSSNGTYIVNLDGISHTISGNATSNMAQPYSLFSARSLDTGSYHGITLTNLGDTVLYIDYLSWTQFPPGGAGTLTQSVLEDTDSSFSYRGAWSTSPPNVASFSGGTGQRQLIVNKYNINARGGCHFDLLIKTEIQDDQGMRVDL